MSDLIRREDAIKAYNEAMDELVKWQMEEWQLGDFSECEFNTTDCKHIVRKLEAIPTIEAVSEWIPCSERLPNNFNEDETVLATTDVDDDRVILMFAVDVKTFYLKGYVSAWMPLPEPYGEREGE